VILVLGVDALDINLCRRYGFSFLESGYVADYTSKYWSTVPSWTSIYTGLTREEHGCPPGWHDWLYNQVKTVGDLADVKPIIYEKPYRELPFVWNLLNHQGKSTGVFKMPLTFPAHRVRGWMISGFPAVNNPRAAYPVDAGLQLQNYAPDIFQRLEPDFVTNFKNIDGLRERGSIPDATIVIKHIQAAVNNLIRLLDWHRPDVLFTGFSFLDHLGHIGIVKEEDQKAIYQIVEWAINEVLEVAEAKATIIVSDHGGEILDFTNDRSQKTFHAWEHTEDGVFWMTEKPDSGSLHEYDVTRHILRLTKQFA